MAKDMGGEEMPVDLDHGPFHFTEGTLTYAGMHLHVEDQLVHTHQFAEIAFAVGGTGTPTTYRKRLAARAAAHPTEALGPGFDSTAI